MAMEEVVIADASDLWIMREHGRMLEFSYCRSVHIADMGKGSKTYNILRLSFMDAHFQLRRGG